MQVSDYHTPSIQKLRNVEERLVELWEKRRELETLTYCARECCVKSASFNIN